MLLPPDQHVINDTEGKIKVVTRTFYYRKVGANYASETYDNHKLVIRKANIIFPTITYNAAQAETSEGSLTGYVPLGGTD